MSSGRNVAEHERHTVRITLRMIKPIVDRIRNEARRADIGVSALVHKIIYLTDEDAMRAAVDEVVHEEGHRRAGR